MRITWDWPGYVLGHLNLAEATRDRLVAEAERRGRARTPGDGRFIAA